MVTASRRASVSEPLPGGIHQPQPKAGSRFQGVPVVVMTGTNDVEATLQPDGGAGVMRARKAPPAESAEAPAEPPHWGLLSAVVVWTGLYFSVFTTLGFIISTALFLLGMTAWFNRGRWTMNILTSVLFSAGSYFMFTKLLGVTLAQGVLPF